MQYMLMMYGQEAAFAQMEPAQLQQAFAAYMTYNRDLIAAGVLRAGEQLKPTGTARTLRTKGGQVVQTDGPFAETKEQLGGYYILEVKDEAEALAWAAKCPGVHGGSVEVRELMPRPG